MLFTAPVLLGRPKLFAVPVLPKLFTAPVLLGRPKLFTAPVLFVGRPKLFTAPVLFVGRPKLFTAPVLPKLFTAPVLPKLFTAPVLFAGRANVSLLTPIRLLAIFTGSRTFIYMRRVPMASDRSCLVRASMFLRPTFFAKRFKTPFLVEELKNCS